MKSIYVSPVRGRASTAKSYVNSSANRHIEPGKVTSGEDGGERPTYLPLVYPRQERSINCVTFPPPDNSLDLTQKWMATLPTPKMSHSARRYAKTMPNLQLFQEPRSPERPMRKYATERLTAARAKRGMKSATYLSTATKAKSKSQSYLVPSKATSGFEAPQTAQLPKAPSSVLPILKSETRKGDKAVVIVEDTAVKSTSQVPSTSTNPQLRITPSQVPSGVTLKKTHSLPGNNDKRVQVFRTVEERLQNPDSINLDKLGLVQFPIIDTVAEPNLRLLSLQHNLINRLDNLPLLNSLVVLDLYDNRIDRIYGLQGLNSLRVLLLGKNRLRRIEGIENLKRLEILDLHGNQLRYVENLGCLVALRVLNLAGNNFKTVRLGSFGLTALTELNLKRNRIRNLDGLQKAPHLKKLYLANNEIASPVSLAPLKKLVFLQEILFEPNPICKLPDYCHYVLSTFPCLELLDKAAVTDQMKNEAKQWYRKKLAEEEEKRKKEQQLACVVPPGPKSREEIIMEARKRWQSLRKFVKTSSKDRKSAKSKLLAIESTDEQVQENAEGLTQFRRSPTPLPGTPSVHELESNLFDDLVPDNGQDGEETALSLTIDNENECTEAGVAVPELISDTIAEPVVSSEQGPEVSKTPLDQPVPKPAVSKIAVVRPLVRSVAQESVQEVLKDYPVEEFQNESVADLGKKSPVPEVKVCEVEPDSLTSSAMEPVLQDLEEVGILRRVSLRESPVSFLSPEEKGGAESVLGGESGSNQTSSIGEERNEVESRNSSNVPSSLAFSDTPPKSGSTVSSPIEPVINKSLMNKAPNVKRPLLRSSSFIHTPSTSTGGQSPSVPRKTPIAPISEIPRRNPKLKALAGQFVSASLDVRYTESHSSEEEEDDDASSFITTNTSELGTGRSSNSARNRLFARRAKVKRERLLSSKFQPGRRPMTGVKDGTRPPMKTLKRCDSAIIESSLPITETVKKQGSDYLVEIDGKILNVYGQGALKHTLAGFSSTLCSGVTTAKFHYITFDTLIPFFGKLRNAYPNLEHFQFRANNLASVSQLNALADLQGITSLHITKEGNPIVSKEMWQSYASYRLSHWGLQNISGKEAYLVSSARDPAKSFESLGYIALSCLPQTALTPLAKRLHTLHCFCCCSPSSSSDDSGRNKKNGNGGAEPSESVCTSWDDDPVLLDVIGKEALVYHPPGEDKHNLSKDRSEVMNTIVHSGFEFLEKLELLEEVWPSLLVELVEDILSDYVFMDNYMKKEYKKVHDLSLISKKFS